LKNLLVTIQAYAFRAGRGLIHGVEVRVLDAVLNVLVSILISFRVLHHTGARSGLQLISTLSTSVVHLVTLEALFVINYSFVDDWVFQVTTELWGDLRQVGLGVHQEATDGARTGAHLGPGALRGGGGSRRSSSLLVVGMMGLLLGAVGGGRLTLLWGILPAVGCEPSRVALLLCSFLHLVSSRNERSLVEPVCGKHGRREQPLQGRLESLMQKVDLLFVIHDGCGLADSVVELAMVKQVRAGVHAKLLVNVVELQLRVGNVVGIVKAKVEVLLEAGPKALPAVCG
jgi:hypothetical protein